MDEDDFLEFFFTFVNIQHVDTLNVYRYRFSRFYQWCMDQGLIQASYNIFEGNVLLDPDTLAAYMSQKCSLFYYDDGYVDAICRNLKTDRRYTETVIRCFYEGMSSYTELIRLKWGDVDLGEGIIRLPNRQIVISDRLRELLQTMTDEKDLEEDNGSLRPLRYQRFGEEDVFPYRITKDTPANRKQYIRRRLETAREELKLESLDAKKLFQSGLLQAVFRACDHDIDQVLKLLYEDKMKNKNQALDQILKEAGYGVSSYRARSMFKPYMMQIADSMRG